mmetsp:Transcript_27578/g.94161  ORF Transcript_27578/g.94161 Transcript_27578/m.94161 type:complete len:95 (-) Transcript_27578:1618-1902(-)
MTIPAGTHLFTAPSDTPNVTVDCDPIKWDTLIVQSRKITSRDTLTTLKSIRAVLSDTELHLVSSIDETLKYTEAPVTYKEAINRPDGDKWKSPP